MKDSEPLLKSFVERIISHFYCFMYVSVFNTSYSCILFTPAVQPSEQESKCGSSCQQKKESIISIKAQS